MIMLHHHLTAAVCAVLIANVAPSAAGRALTDLDQGWRFSESPVGTGQETAAFDDSAWAAVSLPHTWNRLGAREGSASADTYKGAAWYRLHFKAPRAARGARYYLQFDGVGTIADVWLNGKHLGRHEGAFARFRFDATKAIVRTGDNLLAVRADNSAPAPGSPTADVIPLSGDFFVEGGLYRKVALIVAAPLHIDLMDFGGPGVYARALAIGERTATVEVRTRLADDGARQAARLVVRIENAEGKTVAAATQTARVGPRAPAVRTFRLTVPHPHLWDGMSDPYFYQVVVSLKGRRGVVIDEVTQPLGLRTMRFDAEKGFFLNGRHLFLRSVSLHQDAAGKGWAMSCADQKRDFDLVADVGANAVRLAHYQHDQCSYDEADRRGMIVWAEIPLVNQVSFDGGPASPGLAENARRQLSELIRQNYNHPSVVMWSVGNETDLKAVTTNGPGKAGALISSLAVLARHDDPSRPTTYADCCEQSPAPDRDVLVGLTDLLGYNRYFGWYYGEANDFGAMLDKAHAAHPSLPIGVSEYGAGAALTQHSDDPAGGEINPHGRPHPEEYQDVYHEQSWQLIAARPYLWGAYIWNMFDFASVGRQEGDLVGMNDKGLVSYDRAIRKDAFYFYRANWSTAPTLHLVGRRYVDRPYAVLDIKAYSNATRAELLLNGKDIGSVPCEGGICLWKAVHLSPGTNTLEATAVIGGSAFSDAMQWQFHGTPGVVRINAGDISGYIAADGRRYGSDMYFDGGIGKGVNPPDTAAKGLAAVAADNKALYDHYREGNFSYRIPLPDGRYKVTLMFAEPSATKAEERVFDVLANGATVVRRLDVFDKAGGRLRAYQDSFDVTVEGGTLVLEFRPSAGQALLSACEIVPN